MAVGRRGLRFHKLVLWLSAICLNPTSFSCMAEMVEVIGTHCPGEGNQCSLHGSCVINRRGEHVCNCQWGYHAKDCSKRMCPHGFDPTSRDEEEKKLRLSISAGDAAITGAFILSFHSHSIEFETPMSEITSEVCTQIFHRFQNLASVSCSRTSFQEPSTATYEITLHSFPVYPIMNNLYHHNGNPLATEFWCDTSNIRDINGHNKHSNVKCVFESITDRNVKPYVECSNHGRCDETSGICACHDGFYSDNCAKNQDEEDILVAPSIGPFFKGNVLRISARRDPSDEFNLIKAEVSGSPVFQMSGYGNTVLHRGSFSVKEGDLMIQNGQVQIQSGGELTMDNAHVRMTNGRIHVQHTSADHIHSKDAASLALLHIDVRNERLTSSSFASAPDFFRLSNPNGPIFRVSGLGNTAIHEGGLDIMKGGLKVERGGIKVLSDGVKIANGGLELRNNDINVHSGSLNVLNGHIKVVSKVPSRGAVLDLTKENEGEAKAPVLRLSTLESEGSLIQANAGSSDQPVFEVKGSGETLIHGGGLQIASGGIKVATGGQTIASGGLRVEHGGIHIESGGLTTHDGFTIEKGGLTVHNNESNGASLQIASTNEHFGGSLLEFNVSAQVTSPLRFRLLEALEAPDKPIFSVDSIGNLITGGDISTINNGKIVSNGALVSQGQMVFSHVSIEASSDILIPSSHSYVKITSDGRETQNLARIDQQHAYAGQILVIQNEDEQSLNGEISVKPFAAAIYVFDGGSWRALTAASFDTSLITGVKQFEAANDLNFGDIKLTVKSVQVGGQRAGLVAIYGKGGELTQDEAFVFDATSSTLKVDQLQARVVKGSIDMSESELRGVEIVGGHISNVNMTGIEMVEVYGELFVESEAFFGAGITVDGQVMGSGAYVDASDKRFKRDIRPITQASESLAQLNGVEYAFKVDEFPTKKFSRDREMGFIAQEVEQVLPQVVMEDAEGFKYVAYARLLPVVVEAVKEQGEKAAICLDTTRQLQEEIKTLKQTIERQEELLKIVMQRLPLYSE